MSGLFLRDTVYNPFLRAQELLEQYKDAEVDGIIVDFHRESTSEIHAMGFLLDGHASLVFGTHTHVQTSDARILPQGTGYISDIGFIGAQNSLIGDSFKSREAAIMTGVSALSRGQQDL